MPTSWRWRRLGGGGCDAGCLNNDREKDLKRMTSTNGYIALTDPDWYRLRAGFFGAVCLIPPSSE